MTIYNPWIDVLNLSGTPVSQTATTVVYQNHTEPQGDISYTVFHGTFTESGGAGTGFDTGAITTVARTTDAAGTDPFITITNNLPDLNAVLSEPTSEAAYDTITVGDNTITTNLASGDQVYGGFDGGAGNDNITGSGGDYEHLVGGPGTDTLDGNGGLDIADYVDASAGVTVDLSAGTASDDGDGGSDTLIDIDGVVGSQHGDTITGDDSDNFFESRSGDDVIEGNLGRDAYIFVYDGDLGAQDIGDNVIMDFDTAQDMIQLPEFTTANGHSSDVTFADLTITDTTIPGGLAGAGDPAAMISIPGALGAVYVKGIDADTIGDTNGSGDPKYISTDWTWPTGYEGTCFPAGTLFTTSEGTKPVEDLKTGDKLMTLEGREQPVRFIGVQSLIPHPEHGHLERNLPILIKKHALGPNMPSRDLTTTWWHSVMLEGDWIEQQFGSRQIFVPAGRLVNGDSIQTVQTTETLKVYVPMLPAHEVIFAEGAPVETFRPDNGNQHHFDNTADYPLHHLPQDEQETLYPSKFPRILDKDLCAAIRAHMISRNIDARLVA